MEIQIPTKNRISQGRHGSYNSVDYSGADDYAIYSPFDGKVIFYGDGGDCGTKMHIEAADGMRTTLCHLNQKYVNVGADVKRGQLVAQMGHTGYTIPEGPAGTHLHQNIQKGGVYTYPPELTNADFRIYEPPTVPPPTKPPTSKTHVVESGEIFSVIANQYGYTSEEFKKLNPKAGHPDGNYDLLWVGDVLNV